MTVESLFPEGSGGESSRSGQSTSTIDSDPKATRIWEDRFRRRRTFAFVESYLSSNAFILVFLFIYVHALFLMYVWGARDEYVHSAGRPFQWVITIARGFGYTINLTCALVILLAARLSFTMLRETALNRILPFDKTFPAFHIIVGYSILAAVAGHGLFHMIWIAGWNQWKPGLWAINMCVATGFILASLLVLMVATAGHKFRTKNFSAFYAIHNIGAALFFVLLGLHGMYNQVPYTWKWIIGPVGLYLIDRLVRKLATSQVSVALTSRNSVIKGPDVLKISIPKSFNYKAGQYAEIKVPSISKTEWHPFTIASAPHEAEMTFFIKAVGDWTNALYKAFMDRIDELETSKLPILVRGPYGAPAQHIGGYERIVLVSGGVGSTPFSSICRELHHYIEQQTDDHDDRLHSPNDGHLESKLSVALNRKFSVQYGDPKVPTKDAKVKELMQKELLMMTDGMTPKPQNPSKFHRMDYSDLFPANVTTPGGYLGDRARQGSFMPSLPPKAKLQRKPSVRRNIGSSFIMSKGDSRNLLSDGPDSSSSTMLRAKEDFEDKMLHLDDKDVAVAMGQNLGGTTTATQRLLGVLHSIFLNLALFFVLLTRLVIVGYAHIFDVFKFRLTTSEFSFTGARWLFITDLVLCVIVTTIVTTTVMLELSELGSHFFKVPGQLTDLFCLVPLSIASLVLEIVILNRQTNDVENSLLAAILFTAILPVTAIFLGLRLHRIVGARVMLADPIGDVAYHKVRAVDFIWTTKNAEDDAWLLERLIPITDKTKLRLHRYITRGSPEDGGSDKMHDDKALQTNYGRPDWDTLFRIIAQRSPSMSKVGVFFCGPKGMAKSVQAALIKAQTLTNLRGTYLGLGSDKELKTELDLGDVQFDLAKLRRRGSYIRFVFREENFG